ncbi:uncharacterized protein LOC116618442 [Nematostella vectensis]|uniref:uncharacterized protein LOC116618442 n=1 Tax=Nematostella vectensis TaxID=45351 RepID=UPI0020774CCA|nr:uncharacterized protein LOC116618442 [Nematostella vectensis]
MSFKTVYISRVHGNDTDSCGASPDMPCRRLSKGFQHLSPGGTIHLDGTNTKWDPYDCGSRGRLEITVGFTMMSYNHKAHISCSGEGIRVNLTVFQQYNHVKMSELVFKKTRLVFRNPSIVIQDCTLTQATIDMQFAPRLARDITLNRVIFANASQCLKVEVLGNFPGIQSKIVLEVKNVRFQKNAESSPLTLALVHVFGNTSLISVWRNVTVRGNSLPLYRCKVLASHQTYSYIDLTSNIIAFLHDQSIFDINASTINDTFENIFTQDNGFAFLTATGDSIFMEISASYFQRHTFSSASGILNIPAGKYIKLRLLNSTFDNNSAGLGGVLSINGGSNRNVHLYMKNNSISKCSGHNQGLVIVGSKITGVTDLDVIILGLMVTSNSMHSHGSCALCFYANRNIHVLIKGTTLQHNEAADWILGVYHLGIHRGSLEANITETSFSDNHATRGIAYIKAFDSRKMIRFILRIKYLKILRNFMRGSLKTNAFELDISHLTCNETASYCLVLSRNITVPQTVWRVHNSYFGGNERCIFASFLHQPQSFDISVRNTTFDKNNISGIYMYFTYISPRKNISTRGNILLENLWFVSNKIEGYNTLLSVRFKFPFFNETVVNVTIRKALFENNVRLEKGESDRSSLIYFDTPDDTIKGPGMEIKNTKARFDCPKEHFVYKLFVNVENVTFKENVGTSAIFSAKNGLTSFKNFFFKDNSVKIPEEGAMVYLQEGTGGLKISNSEFLRTKKPPFAPRDSNDAVPSTPFLRVLSNGPFEVFSSHFTIDLFETRSTGLYISKAGFVYITNSTKLTCPVGCFARRTNILQAFYSDKQCRFNITKFIYECESCPKTKYSIERGTYFGTSKHKFMPCIPCPFGASCVYNIKSENDFWGFVACNRTQGLNFTHCPEKYCTAPMYATNASVYNGCYGNRTGLLCGACAEGYTESLFGTQCRRHEECNDAWFWAVAGLYTAMLAAYILYKPHLVSLMIKKLLWFKEDLQIQGVSHEGGYTKIVFYFYQIADIIMLQPYTEVFGHTKLFFFNIISLFLSLFNFKIKTVDNDFGCPFVGLTPVTKELFSSLGVFLTMSFLLVFYGAEYLYCRMKKRPKPFLAAYLAAVVEILLLGYERLGETSLKLLSCVPLVVHGEEQLRLFLDAHIRCWNWWQYLLMAYNLTFIIPLIFVLFFGPLKLYRRQISSNMFIAACCFPLPVGFFCLVYCLFMSLRGTQRNSNELSESYRERETRAAVLEVVCEAFRSPAGSSKGAVYWESVLTARRFVFLCLAAFIKSPANRLVIITIICVINLMHTQIVAPFKARRANHLAVALLFVHVVLAVANLSKAVLISAGVRERGPIKTLMEHL